MGLAETMAPAASDRHHGWLRTISRMLRKALSWLILVVAAALFLAASVSVVSRQWQITPILTGSMVPDLPIGSVAISEREPLASLTLGQIALLHPPSDPSVTYVHKIVWLKKTSSGTEIRTRGVANPTEDPWTVRVESPVVYVVKHDVPLVGYASTWLRSAKGRAMALLAAGLLSIVLVASFIRDEIKKRRGQDSSPEQAS